MIFQNCIKIKLVNTNLYKINTSAIQEKDSNSTLNSATETYRN